MSRAQSLVPFLIGGLVAAALATATTFVIAAGGHGNYVAAKLFFPYSFALTHVTVHITPPLVALALAQFPLHAIAAWAAAGRAWRHTGWTLIALAHTGAVFAAFTYASSAFTP